MRRRIPLQGDEASTTWVRPKLVAEIKFAEWTKAGKMRQPAYLGLREDKRAEDVVEERKFTAKVRELRLGRKLLALHIGQFGGRSSRRGGTIARKGADQRAAEGASRHADRRRCRHRGNGAPDHSAIARAVDRKRTLS